MGRKLTLICRRMMRRSQDPASEQGSALVEFSAVVTVVLMAMFGIMDFSRAMYAYHFVSNAAREATRYASVRGSTYSSTSCTNPPPVAYACRATQANITSYVQGIVPSGIYVSSANTSCAAPTAVGQLNVCTTWPGTAPPGSTGACNATSPSSTGDNPGCLVKIQVQYLYGFTLPFVSKSVSSMNISSTSDMVISQ
jgi:Flp pilus assembly protein TadG